MKLAKASANLIVVLAASLGLAAGGWAQQAQGAAAKRLAKRAKAASSKPAEPVAKADVSTDASSPSAKKESTAARRDPFLPLVYGKKAGGGTENLPPGKAGLVVATVKVDGTVRSGNGMIAVVSNPEQRVYFIREGDRLYDGSVEKIGLDGVTFREVSKDAFGKSVEREVTKRIYASAGEQQ